MKKTAFILICSLITGSALFAQSKGDMYISGSLGVNGGNHKTVISSGNTSTTIDTPNTVYFNIAPKFGYFIIDNLEVNLSLEYDLTKTYNDEINGKKLWDRDNMFYITPGVNYYFKLGDKFFYAPGFHLSIGFGNNVIQETPETKTSNGQFGFKMGFDLLNFEFKPTDNIGITLNAGGLYYNMTSSSSSETTLDVTTTYKRTNNSIDFGLNLETSIGFKYYF